jgi:hypothetical protein
MHKVLILIHTCVHVLNEKLIVESYFESFSFQNLIAGCADAPSVTPPPPELVALPPDVVDGDSSSSEDRPIISRRELVGTKRKAEVLSKESGKIGVTITTSSSSSSSSGAGSPPPSKLPRLLPVKSVTAPTSPSYSVSHYETRLLAVVD